MNDLNPSELSDEDIKQLLKDIERSSGTLPDEVNNILQISDLSDYEIDKLLEEYEKINKKEFNPNSKTHIVSSNYQLPLKGGQILSSFVSKELAQTKPGAVASLSRHPEGHEAIDIMVPGFNAKTNTGKGAPVYPIGPGKVIKVTSPSENPKGGITCTIQHMHDYGLTSYYAHLSKLNVNVGTVVDSNTIIGLNGDTGSAKGTAPHVHLSTTLNGKKLNPLTDVIGKPIGSLSKKASMIDSVYKVACAFERIITNNF